MYLIKLYMMQFTCHKWRETGQMQQSEDQKQASGMEVVAEQEGWCLLSHWFMELAR